MDSTQGNMVFTNLTKSDQLSMLEANRSFYASNVFAAVGNPQNPTNCDFSKFISPDVARLMRSMQCSPSKQINDIGAGCWPFMGSGFIPHNSDSRIIDGNNNNNNNNLAHFNQINGQMTDLWFQMPHAQYQPPVAECDPKREANSLFNSASRPPKLDLGMKSDATTIFPTQADSSTKESMSESSSDLLAFLRLHHAKELSESVQLNDTSRPLSKNNSYGDDNDMEQIVVYPNDFNDNLDSQSEVKTSPHSYKKPKVEGSPGPCCVCEAEKAGFHFGAIACAACSAFFRRTISEKRKYTCKKEGPDHLNCPIDKHHRCYCRACRLQKCLSQGMDPLAVQPHRDSIGAKHNVNPKRSSNTNSTISVTERRKKRHSPTPTPKILSLEESLGANFTQNRSIAEQLLAFSRTPVISEKTTISPQLSLFNQQIRADGLIIPKVETESEYEYNVRPGSSGSRTDLPLEDSLSSQSHSPPEVPTPSYNAQLNMIENMVVEYKKILERRRLLYCPGTIRDILAGTKPPVRSSNFFDRMRLNKNKTRAEIGLFVEFLNSIEPFPKLSLDDRVALFKHLSISFSILEKHYSTMRGGGVQTNRIIHSDGSFTDLDDVDSIEKSLVFLTGETMDRNTFIKLFVLPLRESLHELSGPMYYNGTTDVEFCALAAILLFDPAAPGLDDRTRRIVKDARDRVYHDWFAFYRAHNIENGSERMGNTMLLLPAVQSTVEKTAENFHLVRVFELFDYDKILDDVFTTGGLKD